ncbi:MAG: single-stranded DNA-binding protein [Flavobacteriales bacterium]|nr:single-stranded DNA-binding protein [Flavobacteriales bacterium]
MAGVNKVILLGNLGKDPEVKYLEGGVPVGNFTLATSENYKDKTTGEKRTITEWHNIVVWRGLAEITEKFLKKGSQVYVEGKLRTKQWQDKDGNTRYTTEIIAESLQLTGKREDATPQNQSNTSSLETNEDFPSNDDLPF